MQENTKKKLPLIIGLGLPAILILWILLFMNIFPAIFVRPTFDFIYAAGYENEYLSVVSSYVQAVPCPYKSDDYYNCSNYLRDAKIYLYDVKRNTSIPLSLEEAKRYQLSDLSSAPDGYYIANPSHNSSDYYFFPFFWGDSSSDYTYYIKNDGVFAKILNLQGYYYKFKFLGWVINKN